MNRKLLVVLIISTFFVGCISLTQVHNYASTSVEALNKVNDLQYTFSDYCRQDCEMQQLRLGEIQQVASCDCETTAKNADIVIQQIHSTITSYLQAIAKLSNNNDFSYDVTALTQALEKNSLLSLNDKQIAASAKAGNFITKAATLYYRKKKLKQFLGEADSVFQELTTTFIFLIDTRLRAQLYFEYKARTANIKQQLDNTTDKGLKQILLKIYFEEKTYYNKHNSLIDTYADLLKSVKKGYHELYINRNNLKVMHSKELIKLYSQELQYIMSGIKITDFKK